MNTKKMEDKCDAISEIMVKRRELSIAANGKLRFIIERKICTISFGNLYQETGRS